MVFQALAGASLLFFFVLMVWPKMSQAIESFSTVLHVGFGNSIQCTVVDEQKLIDDISFHLSLCLRPFEVEDSTVSNVDSIFQAIKCIKQHRRKHDTEKSGARTHPCLTPFMMGKATELSLLSCTLACMPS